MSFETPVQWMKARQKKPLVGFHEMLRGFGRDGDYSIYLASPKATSGWKIVNGKPAFRSEPSCLVSVEVRTARDNLIEKLVRTGLEPIELAVPLFGYAIELLNYSYQAPGTNGERLTDEDLSFILGGTKWCQPVVTHAMGGEDVIAGLIERRREQMRRSPALADTALPHAPARQPSIETTPPLMARMIARLRFRKAG